MASLWHLTIWSTTALGGCNVEEAAWLVISTFGKFAWPCTRLKFTGCYRASYNCIFLYLTCVHTPLQVCYGFHATIQSYTLVKPLCIYCPYTMVSSGPWGTNSSCIPSLNSYHYCVRQRTCPLMLWMPFSGKMTQSPILTHIWIHVQFINIILKQIMCMCYLWFPHNANKSVMSHDGCHDHHCNSCCRCPPWYYRHFGYNCMAWSD